MAKAEITFSNRAYAKRWFANLERQSPNHFAILKAIIEEIDEKDGGEISKADLYRRRPEIEVLIQRLGFDPVPSRGQMLRNNGNGIRHAKFAPSRSIAVVWENIRTQIYVTFDDHAPIAYHRAIAHLREIKMGASPRPKRAKNTGRFLRNLRQYWLRRHFGKLKGFNPRSRFYE